MTTLERSVLGLLVAAVAAIGSWGANALLNARTDIATIEVRVHQLEATTATSAGVPAQLAVLATQMEGVRSDLAGIKATLDKRNR